MKLVVFSICHNEEATIGELLDRIPQRIDGVTEIVKWVISDGSTDDTVRVARDHGARVLDGSHQKRLGLRFEEAVEIALSEGADVAVGIDGDLQFEPEDIPQLLEPVISGKADVAVADRFADPVTSKRRRPDGMPASKYFANRVGAWVVSRLTGYRFSDVTSGFRAYSRKALLAMNINSRHTYTQETFQVLALKRMDIAAVPTKVTYFPERKSRVVTNFVSFVSHSVGAILRAFRDFAPLRFFGILGLAPLLVGMASLGFLGVHWLRTGELTPYKSVGFIGVYLVSVALFLWGIGLVADMFRRVTENQEKLLRHAKALRWGLGDSIDRRPDPSAEALDPDDVEVGAASVARTPGHRPHDD